ncbi:hypothetical protein [Sphingomonas koreensis]|uniref:hypothetical protein n=1 Tax=Sphingomonas koreensis TaxID=93064 RepID=UPI00234F2237|nr:hypothetical protein [Sphingomonas koreensis]MDC7811977.1 hypothetical protein [Sphingomonas koreensis]
MRGLERRAARLGDARAAKLAARVAAAVGSGVPGVSAAAEADRVILSGRGLSMRAATDPLLQGLGSWVR